VTGVTLADPVPTRAGQDYGVGPGQRRRPVSPAIVASMLLAAGASLPLLRIFGSPGLQLLVLAVPASTLVAAVVRVAFGRIVRDQRSTLPLLAGFVAGLAVGTLPEWFLAAPDPFGPSALGPRMNQALTDGWQLLLSVQVPVPDTRSFSDLPVLVTATLSACVVLIALSARPAAALLPATVAFGGLLVLGVHGPAAGTTLAGCYALAVLVFLVTTAPSANRRALVSAGVSAVLLVAITLLAVVTVRPGTPYNPREHVRPPVDVTVQQDPLAMLSARLETPDVPVLTARLSGALLAHPRNWMVLAYQDYDGAGWLESGAAEPTAASPPAPGTIGSGGAQVATAASVTLLPHPAYVLDTSPVGLGYDPGSELLASPRGIRHYAIQASVTQPSLADLASAGVPIGVPAALIQTPACVPATLSTLASEMKATVTLPAEQAVRLQNVFRSAQFHYDQAAPPGEGCGSLDAMLASRKGTSAQFATAFVLAARLMGLPARLAVGYLPGQLAGHTASVTDADAFAWPQVLLTGVGWVDFDPTPTGGSASHLPAREQQPALHKVQVNPPSAKNPGPPPITAAAPPRAGLSALAVAGLAVAAVVALVLLWVSALRWRVRRRRQRLRRAAEPAARVLGAWDEFLIPLSQTGVSIQGLSAPSVARSAAGLIPREAHSVGQLALLAERALYDEIAENDAVTAWRLSDRARAAASAAAGNRARLRRIFLPGGIRR
jgi:Transglutaminase-like superfamily